MTSLNWDDLRFFLALARAGNTVAAGRLLHVNPSTISRRIQGLEESLGVRLFDRDGVGYRMTETARTLMPEAEKVEEAVTTFERRAILCEEEAAGTLRLTCTEGTAIFMMRPVLRRFNERYPDITVNVIVSDSFLDIGRGEADIALRVGTPSDENLVGRKLADLCWAFYASERYLSLYGRPETVEDLPRHRIIGFNGTLHEIRSARWLRQIVPERSFVSHTDTLTGLIMVLNAGTGIGLLPMQLGEKEKENGLVRLFGPVREVLSPFWVLTHRDMKMVPRVRAFMDFIIEEVRVHGEELLGHPLDPFPADTPRP